MKKLTTLILTGIAWLGLANCEKPSVTRTNAVSESPKKKLKLTSEWHREEEAKIDGAVAELRGEWKWDERWDKFSMLGDYGWRSGMDCGDGTKPMPCMSGGYTFSQQAFEKLRSGDLSHDARNTVEESHKSFQALIEQTRR